MQRFLNLAQNVIFNSLFPFIFHFYQQPANGTRDKRMGRVPGSADKDRFWFNGQPGVHGNNGENSQTIRLHSDIRLGSVRRRHCKRCALI